ncbi:hypothetical protein RI129_006824 [Pyrocoelia pectoralis]|uniref:T-cell immunomodulatory protein TIP C2 domain-containing protein n=1 Tax=Pyrocoelia pectoralis TaxID=417401 RepID=A0AAN7VKB7_9COLE
MLHLYLYTFLIIITHTRGSDITNVAFGTVTDGMPAAFGDFDSDELTDVFVLRNNGKTVEILLGNDEEPLLHRAKPPLQCEFKNLITSVVPGDFDGDALMDIAVTTIEKRSGSDDGHKKSFTALYIIWGGGTSLNCSKNDEPIFHLIGQPLALDYNQDMIIDLFGVDVEGNRMFWVFDTNRAAPTKIQLRGGPNTELMKPHAHAFLDINEDYMGDIFMTTKDNFEIWYGSELQNFVYSHTIPHPPKAKKIGQSIFLDVELLGRMDLITPVCYDDDCRDSALLVYYKDSWHNLQVNFKESNGNIWGFALREGRKYTNAITLHCGDFNMDGYPDILATLELSHTSETQSFLLENIACENDCDGFSRTYRVHWSALQPFKNGTVMAVFFDFYQDGILDVILVENNITEYKTVAFKNSLDYDANFIKVMVLTGLSNKNNHMIDGRVGKKRRTYGTNLPGPSISYRTTTQEGNSRHAISAQLPQSAHFSLNLPYTIFGLGRTPNFVDTLTVGLSNYSKDWTQIIPNSQMVVIPWPTSQPSKWKAQLFVTPSKVILTSVAALTGVCGLITIIIGVLHWKERQEDKRERLQESHRFHFDAM